MWFGEALPERALEASFAALAACDVFMSVGTSAVVQPAAGFVHVAKQEGASTVEINRDATPITEGVDVAIQGQAGEVLPRIVSMIGS